MTRTVPAVSVVIPTYDRFPYLRQAVDSVLAQTYSAWELIVVDDGSGDATPAYLAALRDSRVRVVRLRHTGSPALARNAGVRDARCRYVAFLDSDDIWRPGKLDQQLAAMAARTPYRWSYTNYDMIDANNGPITRPAGGPWRPYSGWILEDLVWTRASVSTPTVVVERALFLEAGGFDEAIGLNEDYDLWLRLATRAEAVAVDAVLASVRNHQGRLTTKRVEGPDSKVVIYDRLRGASPLPAVRRACRWQAYRHRLEGARAYSGDGRHGVALMRVAGALRYGVPGPSWVGTGAVVAANYLKAAARRLLPRGKRESHATGA